MIYPAIDLQNGSSVRLYQGNFTRQTLVAADPVKQAVNFRKAGINRLHLVDLDGAKAGLPRNRATVAQIRANFTGEIEIGGGIRDEATIDDYLRLGVERVVLGSAALNDPEFTQAMLKKYGAQRITIGVDGRDGMVATDGWLNQSQVTMSDLIAMMVKAGARRFIVTDTATDGTLGGPNIDLLSRLQREFIMVRVVASGGVGGLSDILKLRQAGLKDAIVGKALATGRLTLRQIMEVNQNAG